MTGRSQAADRRKKTRKKGDAKGSRGLIHFWHWMEKEGQKVSAVPKINPECRGNPCFLCVVVLVVVARPARDRIAKEAVLCAVRVVQQGRFLLTWLGWCSQVIAATSGLCRGKAGRGNAPCLAS